MLRAYHGFEQLSEEQITKEYGSPAVFDCYTTEYYSTEDFHTFPGYFETNNMILYAKVIQLKQRGKLDLSHLEIFDHI